MAYGLPDWVTGSTKPEQPTAPKTKDGGLAAPDRNKREMCYESRDFLFECLDKNNILDANKEDEKMRQVCGQENNDYERDCARSWIKYFKEKRVVDYKRDQAIQQYQKEDAAMAAKAKEGKRGGYFS